MKLYYTAIGCDRSFAEGPMEIMRVSRQLFPGLVGLGMPIAKAWVWCRITTPNYEHVCYDNAANLARPLFLTTIIVVLLIQSEMLRQ